MKTNGKLRPFFGSQRNGVTLIEVIAATAVCGTLLAGLLLALAKHQKQIRIAEMRIRACSAADEILAEWMLSPEGVPTQGSGPIPGHDRFHWRAEIATPSDFVLEGVEVVRISFLSPASIQGEQAAPLEVSVLVKPSEN